MDEKETTERLIRIEERAKSNTHRLDKLELVVDEIHNMSTTMVKLVEEVKYMNTTINALDKKMERMDNRVDEMERSPVEDVKAYKRTAVTSIISTIAGACATGIIFLITQSLL